MAKRIGDSNCWVRIFEVNEPTRHHKGFTVYKVVSTVFPKAFPESATRIVVWKRYSDFRKLHKELEQIFKQLYLKGEFPEFPKSKVFGRFEHDVVEERRKAALALLEFTANFLQLFTSRIFIQFFENGYSSQDFIGRILFSKGSGSSEEDPPTTVFAEKSELNVPCLEPQKVWNAPKNSLSEEDCVSISASSVSSSLSPDNNPEAPLAENGCDPLPSFPILSNLDLVNNDEASNENVSVLSPKPDEESELKVQMDSTSDACVKVKTSHDGGVDEPSTSKMDSTTRTSGIVRSATVTDDLSSYYDEEFEDAAFLFPMGSCSSLDTLPGYTPTNDTPESQISLSSHSSRGMFSLPRRKPSGFGLFDFLPLFPKKSKKKSEKNEKSTKKTDVKTKKSSMVLSVGYICEAAGHFAVAQFHESNTEYEDAFTAYKEGIRVLLAGAQDDTDRDRKMLARNKVEKYLNRAESLKESFLSPGTSNGNGAITPVFSSPNRKEKCLSALNQSGRNAFIQQNGLSLFSSLEELKLYKVVGLGPARSKILVVMNPNEPTPKCFAAKVLWKSSCLVYPDKPTVIPGHVPFMVKLEKWFDTPDKIILLLEHASGGRLVDFVLNYQSKRISFVFPPDIDTPSEDDPKSGFDGVLNEMLNNVGSAEPDLDMCIEESLDTAVSEQGLENTLPGCLDERPEILVTDVVPTCLDESTPTPFLTPPEDDLELQETIFKSEQWTPEMDVSKLLENSKALLQTVSKTLEEGKTVNKVEGAGPGTEANEVSTKDDVCSEQDSAKAEDIVTTQDADDHEAPNDENTDQLQVSCDNDPRLQEEQQNEGCGTPKRMVPEGCIKVWAAEMIMALEALHNAGITYGNLNINDILLGENGHILLRYRSLWKDIDDPVACNTYMAPEVRDSIGIPLWKVHSSADFWSVGAILFLLITGQNFDSAHPEGVFSDMVIKVPECSITGNQISKSAQTLLLELLQHSPEIRLGYYGAAEIKTHPFFDGFDWDKATEDCTAEN